MPRGKRRGGGRGKAGYSKSLKPVIRSAKEIENGISSTPTVKWDPFSVLPKEIYLEIFNKLDDPTDKQNFMNAHVKFYDLFKAERVKFLFGKLIEDLLEEDQNSSEEDEDSSEEENGDDQSFLRLRLVCREWDKAVQRYLQLHPDHFQFKWSEDEWKNPSKPLKKPYSNGYLIEWEHRSIWACPLESDLVEFKASHPPSKNPILTRKITIRINTEFEPFDPDLRDILSQVDSLLETYGHHIWHFNFQDDSDLTAETFSRILKWLRLMPELKTIQMDVGLIEVAYYGTGVIETEPPELKKLLNFHVSNFPYFAFNNLLEGMKAVEKVEVCHMSKLQGFRFPTNLQEAAFDFVGREDIEYLKTLEQLPVLRKLIIDQRIDVYQGSVRLDDCANKEYSWPKWETVWAIIEEKYPALEALHLSLPFASNQTDRKMALEQSLSCRLNLKSLKRLWLEIPNLSCMDFLQDMKTLQELKITLHRYHKEFESFGDLVRKETVQFNRDLGTLWESNIWEVFPNLRKLTIHDERRKANARELHSYEKGTGEKKIYNKIINP